MSPKASLGWGQKGQREDEDEVGHPQPCGFEVPEEVGESGAPGGQPVAETRQRGVTAGFGQLWNQETGKRETAGALGVWLVDDWLFERAGSIVFRRGESGRGQGQRNRSAPEAPPCSPTCACPAQPRSRQQEHTRRDTGAGTWAHTRGTPVQSQVAGLQGVPQLPPLLLFGASDLLLKAEV